MYLECWFSGNFTVMSGERKSNCVGWRTTTTVTLCVRSSSQTVSPRTARSRSFAGKPTFYPEYSLQQVRVCIRSNCCNVPSKPGLFGYLKWIIEYFTFIVDYMKDPGKYDAEIMKFGEYGKWMKIAWSCRTYMDQLHAGHCSCLEIKNHASWLLESD